MWFEFLSRKYTVKNETRVWQRSSLNCKWGDASSVSSIGGPKLWLKHVVVRAICLAIDVLVTHVTFGDKHLSYKVDLLHNLRNRRVLQRVP
jgi:hypothetical protein